MSDIRINLDPKIWGPYGWLFIQSCILSYPNNPKEIDKQGFKQLIESLRIVLPCLTCRDHISEYISKNPLDETILNNRDNILKWILGAQNNVNKLNNKKIISYNEFIDYYKSHYSINNINDESCTASCNKKCIKKENKKLYKIMDILYIISFVIILIICIKCYKKIQK
jgi:hypothetical protein